MVSQLSARLMSGYSSGNSSCGGGSVGSLSHSQRQAVATPTTTAAATSATTRSVLTITAGGGGASSTGYSADREGGNHRFLLSSSGVFLPNSSSSNNNNNSSSNNSNNNNGIDTLKSVASSSVTSSKAGVGALKNAPQPSRASTPPYVIDLLSRGNKKREATTTLTRSLKPGSANASVSSSQHGGGASQSHSHHHGHHEEANKRFKHTETLFNASNVKADLTRGGLTYPELSTLRPRILLDRVNLSNVVELISAKDFDRVHHINQKEEENGNDDPTEDPVGTSTATTTPTPFLDDAAESTLVNLIQECRSFYRLDRNTNPHLHHHTPATTTPNATAAEVAKRVDTASPDIDSSTSSMTDTESEENQNGMMTEPSNDSNDVTRRPNYITMGEALSITSQPRLVALAFAPFLVVHVNAAYTRLTGISSVKILGQPLAELLATGGRNDAPSQPTTLLQNASTTIYNLLNLDDSQRIWNFRSTTGKKESTNAEENVHGLVNASTTCQIVLSPVGQESQVVTHFAMDLQEATTTTAQPSSARTSTLRASSAHHRAEALNVMA